MVLFWILSNAAKKKTPPRGRQPWDEARRRQPVPPTQPMMEPEREIPRPIFEPKREVSPPFRPFPKLQDLGRDLKEALEGEFFPVEKAAEEPVFERNVPARGETYRLKKKNFPPPVIPEIMAEETIPSFNDKKPVNLTELLSLSSQGVVQGIIMSEILQPPRSKRPLRY